MCTSENIGGLLSGYEGPTAALYMTAAREGEVGAVAAGSEDVAGCWSRVLPAEALLGGNGTGSWWEEL